MFLFVSSRNHKKATINPDNAMHSGTVIPIFPMLDDGREAAVSVRKLVSPVSLSSNDPARLEKNEKGYVNGTMHPRITISDDTGTIIRFVKIKYGGKLLKRRSVNGSVPAWATIVTATDFQTN